MPTPLARAVWMAAAVLLVPGCEEGQTADEEAGGELCYDGFDNDSDGVTDCDDDGCLALYSCCVGSTRPGCCAPPQTHIDVDFSACADGTVDGCEPGLGLIGMPGPRIEAGGLAPGGGSTDDGGAWWTDPFDPATSLLVVELEAAARTADCTGSCVDAVGVALVANEPTATANINARVGLIVSASRRELVLMVSGTVVESWPLTDDAFHRWRLTSSPDGTVRVEELDGAGGVASLLTDSAMATTPERAWLVVYGRTPAIDPGTAPSRVSHLSVTRSFCDFPTAAIPEEDPVLPAPAATWLPPSADIESAGIGVNAAGTERLAFGMDGAIHLAGPMADGSYEPAGPWPTPAFDAPGFAAGGIGDPYLVADEIEGRWVLYFSAWDGSGFGSVGRVLGDVGFADSFDPGTAEMVAVAAGGGFDSIDQPAVLDDLMVARATTTAGLTSLVVLRRSPAGDTFDFAGKTPIDSQIRVTRPLTFAAFDRDELGQPALALSWGVYRLLFHGRRGTRWHLGLLVSDDGIWWRDPLDGDELVGTDDSGFDALGMLDPSAIAEDGGLRTFYLGTDGASESVGRFRSGGWQSWPLP